MLEYENLHPDNFIFSGINRFYGKRVIKLYGMITDIAMCMRKVDITQNFLNNTTLILRQPLTREPLVSSHVQICHCSNFRGMGIDLRRLTEVTECMKIMKTWWTSWMLHLSPHSWSHFMDFSTDQRTNFLLRHYILSVFLYTFVKKVLLRKKAS